MAEKKTLLLMSWFIAVSYTHLDVYKRQGHVWTEVALVGHRSFGNIRQCDFISWSQA